MSDTRLRRVCDRPARPAPPHAPRTSRTGPGHPGSPGGRARSRTEPTGGQGRQCGRPRLSRRPRPRTPAQAARAPGRLTTPPGAQPRRCPGTAPHSPPSGRPRGGSVPRRPRAIRSSRADDSCRPHRPRTGACAAAPTRRRCRRGDHEQDEGLQVAEASATLHGPGTPRYRADVAPADAQEGPRSCAEKRGPVRTGH